MRITRGKNNHNGFSQDEDIDLLNGVIKYGVKWSKIVKDNSFSFLRNRKSSEQLRLRFRILCPLTYSMIYSDDASENINDILSNLQNQRDRLLNSPGLSSYSRKDTVISNQNNSVYQLRNRSYSSKYTPIPFNDANEIGIPYLTRQKKYQLNSSAENRKSKRLQMMYLNSKSKIIYARKDDNHDDGDQFIPSDSSSNSTEEASLSSYLTDASSLSLSEESDSSDPSDYSGKDDHFYHETYPDILRKPSLSIDLRIPFPIIQKRKRGLICLSFGKQTNSTKNLKVRKNGRSRLLKNSIESPSKEGTSRTLRNRNKKNNIVS